MLLVLTAIIAMTSRSALGQGELLGTRSHRIVHMFDFDEAGDGNLEDTPMYWRALRPEGFPHYAAKRSGFDAEVGHDAPPSFRLDAYGRNVAYLYSGPGTRVRSDTSYVIAGSILPDRLLHGRALLSAVYLDHRARPILDTLVNSEIVGGDGGTDGWQQVRTYLPPAPADAVTIGLVVWVLQEEMWDTNQRMHRHIRNHDVRSGAWFDDLAVHALPRVVIETDTPGHIVGPEEDAAIKVLLADAEDDTLVGRFSVLDENGAEWAKATIPVSIGEGGRAQRVAINHLPPGVYLARLDVFSGSDLIVSRYLRFVRAAAAWGEPDARARSLGVEISPKSRAPYPAELDLLRGLHVGSAKLPIWGGEGLSSQTPRASKEMDAYLRALLRSGFSLTAVIAGLPDALRSDRRPLVEVFADDSGGYRPHLAAVLASYAAYFRWWQLGSDADDEVAEHERLADALDQLRAEMKPFVSMPRLMAPASSRFDRGSTPLPAEGLSLTLHHELQPDGFAGQVEVQRMLGSEALDVFVEPQPEGRYHRDRWRADWARRVIRARHSGAGIVYVAQPWTVRRSIGGLVAEPKAEYLLLRTIADVLGDAEPGGALHPGSEVEALLFYHETDATVVLWDRSAPAEGRVHAVQLGAATQQIDLWGQTSPIEKDEEGRHLLRLTPMPIFVPGVQRWLLEFQMAVRLDPPRVDFGASDREHRLLLANHSSTAISGEVRLIAPDSWTLEPAYFNVSLAAGRSESQSVQVVFPHTEPAGTKRIIAQMTISPGGYYVELPLTFELGLADLDVWAVPVIEGADLVLRHMVTNRSNEILQLRGSASAPGRSRQYKPFTNLRPGDTASAEYRISGGAALSGRTVRLMLREVGDGSRMHNLEVRVP